MINGFKITLFLLKGKGLTQSKFLKKCIPYLTHWHVFEHFHPNNVYVCVCIKSYFLCFKLLQKIPWGYLGMTVLGYQCSIQATSWTISPNAVIRSLIEHATMRS